MASSPPRDVWLEQAVHCDGRSPLYAALCRRFADDPAAAAILGPEPDWDAPLRLLGGLHYLVLGGEAGWDDPLERHAAFLRRFVAAQGVQTNEVQRSWVLAPLLLRVAQRTGADRLHLVELGPSAGLNLVWDRYRHRYAAGVWGPDDAPLELSGEERGRVPGGLLALAPRVVGRVGVDRAPVDVTTEDGARLLRAFVWADQTDRLERLERAIEAVRSSPPKLVRGDFVELLPQVLRAAPDDRLLVVFQTAVLGYLDEAARRRVRAALDEAGRARPLAFVSTGRGRTGESSWGLRAVFWPGGEREFLGHADYHGAWLDWSPA